MHYKWITLFVILCCGINITAQDMPPAELIYAYTSETGAEVKRYNPETQEIETILSFPDRVLRCFIAFPENNQIAYIVDTPENVIFDGRSSDFSFLEPVTLTVFDLEQNVDIISSPEMVFSYCPIWSSDGQRALHINRNDYLIFDITTGQSNSIFALEDDMYWLITGLIDPAYSGVRWSPDNTTVAFTVRGNTYIYNLEEGLSEITSDPQMIDERLSWSPTSEALTIQSVRPSSDNDEFLSVYSLETQSLWHLTEDEGVVPYIFGWKPDSNELLVGLQGNSNRFLADVDTLSISLFIEGVHPRGIHWLSDGETIVYAQFRTETETGTYNTTLEIIQQNINTGEQVIASYQDSYVLGIKDLIITPDETGYLLIYRYFEQQIAGLYYDVSRETFTLLLDMPPLAYLETPVWSPNSDMLAYSYQTNTTFIGDRSEYFSHVLNMDTNEHIYLLRQPFDWDAVGTIPPYFVWIQP